MLGYPASLELSYCDAFFKFLATIQCLKLYPPSLAVIADKLSI